MMKYHALSPDALREMAVAGTISPEAYEAALRFLGIRPDPREWNFFWRRMLGVWGVLFFASGVICFFAYNWSALHHFAKFALLGSLILCSGLVAAWRGPDSTAGKLALLPAALCIGPLLAVYGQTYQSGASAWELFRVWTLALLPLAFAGRQGYLWLLVWMTAGAWGGLYLAELPMRGDIFPGAAEFFLAQTLCLVGWEALTHHWKDAPDHQWLKETWLPRIIGFATLSSLTACLGAWILAGQWPGVDLFLPGEMVCTALYVALLGGGWLWYRKRRPDLFMLSCGVFSLAALLACAFIRMDHKWGAGTFLLWGLLIAGIAAGCGFLLRRLHAAMEAEKTAAPDPPSPASDFLGKYRTRFSWDAVWDHLRQAQLLAGDPPPIPDKPVTPWYIAAQLALGGWISALFFICFLVLFVSMTLEIHSPEGPLFVGGICFLTIAGLLMRRNSLFTEQFALALALAGSGAAAGAVFMATEDARTALLIASFVIAATYPFIHNGAYRHVAAVAGLLSFFVGLDFLVWNLEFAWHDAHEIMSKPWIERLVMIAAWHVFLGVFAAYGRLTEHQWRTKARLNALLPPLLNGAYCVLLLSVAISLLNSFEFWILAPYGRMAGIGAGVALMYCAHILTAALDGTSRIRLLFLGLAVMTAVGGWFLPGLSVGLLGLALGRLRGSFAVLLVANTAMLLYFICYYYNLDTSLMYKSIALAGSGVFLCLAAWFIGRRQDTGTGGEDA